MDRETKTALALTAIPPVITGYLIAHYSVNAIHSDQWVHTLPWMAKWLETGDLPLKEMWEPRFEHRLFFPSLVMAGLAKLTHWNTKAEIWSQWLLAGLTLFNVNGLRAHTSTSIWLLPVASLFLFSPYGYENWMLGFQIHFWIPVACWTGALWAVCSNKQWINMGLTALLATIASYSIASGMFIWPILAALLYLKYKWYDVMMWLCIPLVVIVNYFIDYHPEPYQGTYGYLYAFTHPTEMLLHWLSYWGNGFPVPAVVGCGMVCLAMASIRRLAATWIGMLVLVLMISGATTVGRMCIPSTQSRYQPFIALAYIAICAALLKNEKNNSTNNS